MSLSRLRHLGALVLATLAAQAFADGNVQFGSAPAVDESRGRAPRAEEVRSAEPTARSEAARGRVEHLPGVNRAIFTPVTPLESDSAAAARTVPADLNDLGTRSGDDGGNLGKKPDSELKSASALRIGGDAAPAAPASVAELARALRNNPDLIYEYVRNNIEYYPSWGIQKGALGTLLDNQGTAFDQAALMVELLRQSGYTASYVKGRINLTAAQVGEWLGVSTTNVCAVLNLLGNAQIPVSSVIASAAGSCPGSTASLVSLKVDHVWVKVNIGGTNYVFDPSFKPHTVKPGLNLAGITGYNATSYLSSAKTGAIVTADYVQSINRTNIRNTLTGYANSLASHVRTNLPAGTLDDVVGGKTIVPHGGGALRQTSLPYQDTTVAVTEWLADVPATFKPTLRLVYSGIDRTYTSDAIYGKRLSITYNASNQPQLMLDGALVVTGTAVAAGAVGNVSFTVNHPYAQTFANQSFTQQIKAGGTFVIGNGWGPASRGLIEKHRSALDQAKAAGSADASEPVMGSTLATISAQWIAQVNHSDYLTDRLAGTNTLFHHQIGIAGYNTAAYVDLPGNVVSVVSQSADAAKEAAAFYSNAMHSSILESTTVQQTTGGSAVSTVKLIDIAATNGDKIFDAKSSNFATVVQPALLNCAAWIPTFQSAVAAGRRLILPGRCNLVEASWTGAGYFDIRSTATSWSIGAIISGGLAGGFSTSILSAPATTTNTLTSTVSTPTLVQSIGTFFGDPIDMVKGHYLYAHSDITTGVGEFPAGLQLQRLYSSGLRTSAGAMGKGWTHNFAASAKVGSDGLQGMGEDSPLDAVNAIVEKMVSLDLMVDTAKPLDKMVVATLGQRWFGDQIIGNTVIVQQGLNGEIFVKLPDGTYSAPPGNAAKLIRNADTTYSYETLNKAKLNFNTAGKVASFVHPTGIQVNFTYTGNDLTRVANSLGRSLVLTNVSGRITQVADGTRNVKYVYDASGNLTTFTDATLKNTTYQYDLPGRMTRLFYPSAPTVPFLVNVYDTLGRVQTQTNASGRLYTYYFAGWRSEEVQPGGAISQVSFMDANGRVTKSVNPLGRVTLNTYDGQSRLTKSVLPEGSSVEYVYDDVPCLAQKRCTHNVKTVRQVAKPASGLATLTSSFTFESAFNKVASATDAAGRVSTYTYTAQGNPLTVTSPADAGGVQPSTTFGYTAFAPVGFPSFYLQTSASTKTTATNTVLTTTAYNAANKYVPQTTVVDSGTGKLNLATAFTYDAFGNLTQVNGPRTDVTDTVSYAYDAERRVTQTTNALAKATRYAYDANGRLTTTAAQLGTQWLVSCRSYTATDKLLKAWGPALTAAATTCPTAAAPVPVTDYAYDTLDRLVTQTENLTLAEGGNRVTQTVYNADSSVNKVQRAVGTALVQDYARYTYTTNGLVATVTDARGYRTTYQYDGHDRKVKTLFPDKVTAGVSSTTDFEQYGFDAVGNLTSLRKRSGQSIAFAYDNLNRLTARTYPTVADNVSFAYDLVGRRTAANFANGSYSVSYVWDNAGRLTSTTAGGKTLAHQYDPAGNRTRTTWPEATAFFVTTTYDALNRPATILENGLASLASYAYDDLSRRTTVTLGNTTTQSTTYSNEALASLTINLAGTAQDLTRSFTRNQAREILADTWSNDLYQWNGAATGSKAYTANGQNQYTAAAGAAISHDANGNLTGDGVWSYGYDLDNRLKTATKTGYAASLAYDAEGRMRQTTLAGVVTNLAYDGTDLVAEYDAAGTLLRRYVHGPGIDEPLVWYEGATTTSKTWLYADQAGSIVAQANSTGTSTASFSYGPFGEANVATGVRFRYTGQQYLGPLNLYHYKARFYSPALGRFLQTDPIGYADDLNLYAYVGNNPANRTDPSGLIASEAIALGTKLGQDSLQAGASFANGFIGGNGSGTAFSLGAGTRVAVDWGLVAIDVLNTPVSPGPDVGIIGAIGIGSRAAKETVTVQRWMSKAELKATQETGLLRGGRDGTHYVTDAANSDALRARQRLALPQTPEVRATMQVPRDALSAPSRVKPDFNMPGGGMERTATGNVPVRIIKVD